MLYYQTTWKPTGKKSKYPSWRSWFGGFPSVSLPSAHAALYNTVTVVRGDCLHLHDLK